MASSYKGLFYLPDEEEKKLAGNLVIDDSGSVKLELFGSFNWAEKELITIWGKLFNNKSVSLLNCFVSYSTEIIFSENTRLEVYTVNRALIGISILSTESVHFNKISARVENLSQWLGVSGQRLSVDGNHNIEFTYSVPKAIEFKISEAFLGRFVFEVDESIGVDGFNLKQNAYLEIVSEKIFSLNELLTELMDLKKLLSLFWGREVGVEKITLKSNDEISQVIKSKDGTEYSIHEQIAVYFKDIGVFREKSTNQYLVQFAKISHQFEEIIQKWTAIKNGNFYYIIDIILSSLSRKLKVSNEIFLSIFQGIEGFHRSQIQVNEDAKVLENKERIHRILTLVPNGPDKTWLEDILRYSYEPNARERLKFAFDKNINFLAPSLAKSAYKPWINKILKYRHHLTHPGKSEKMEITVMEIFYFSNILEALLLILIFEQLEIPTTFINKNSFSARYASAIEYLSSKSI